MAERVKEVKYAIFYVIRNKDDSSKILIVKRPNEDIDLPGGVWGLPAGSVKEGETYEEAIVRNGRNKLGVELKARKILGRGNLDRGDYILHGEEYEAEIVSGTPNVPQENNEGTQYQDWKWGTYEDLIEAASKHSLCCNLYLKSIGEKVLGPI